MMWIQMNRDFNTLNNLFKVDLMLVNFSTTKLIYISLMYLNDKTLQYSLLKTNPKLSWKKKITHFQNLIKIYDNISISKNI